MSFYLIQLDIQASWWPWRGLLSSGEVLLCNRLRGAWGPVRLRALYPPGATVSQQSFPPSPKSGLLSQGWRRLHKTLPSLDACCSHFRFCLLFLRFSTVCLWSSFGPCALRGSLKIPLIFQGTQQWLNYIAVLHRGLVYGSWKNAFRVSFLRGVRSPLIFRVFLPVARLGQKHTQWARLL